MRTEPTTPNCCSSGPAVTRSVAPSTSSRQEERITSRPSDSEGSELADLVASLAAVARHEATLATHDVSDGGLAVALAELVTKAAGADVALPDRIAAFDETPGRLVVQTTDPEAVADLAGGSPCSDSAT